MKYQFCQQIDRNLCFNKNYLSSCTVGNNTKNQSIPFIKKEYNGEILNWIDFFKEREEIKKGFKAGHPLETCDGCYFLRELEWDNINETWEFKYIQFSHWQMCNSNCIYCDNHTVWQKNKKDTYDSVPVLKDLIERKYINQRSMVDFAGGEPTLYYHFNEMLNMLINADIKKIIVHTNAIIYSKMIEKGIRSGNISICVSLDAGSKQMHEKVKGVKSYNKVWKNIEKYAKAKNPLQKNNVTLKYIIIPNINDSEEEIELWILKSLKANVTELILNADNNIFINRENFEENLKKVISLSEYFVRRAKELYIQARLEFNVAAAYKTLNIPIPSFDYY